MNVLIGDIGNTNTKICLIEFHTFKIKKLIYFNSSNILSKNFLKRTLKKWAGIKLSHFKHATLCIELM